MRGSVAFSSLSVLFLVLQASLSVARPQAERSLLAVTIRAAGAGCADGESCSSGASTTVECPAGGGECPVISAGNSCRTNDACSTGVLGSRQPCPADPDTNGGTCPLIPAGENPTPCRAKDKCATSATTSGVCTLLSTTSDSGSCSSLPIGASCTSLAGDCTPNEECNATPPVSLISSNPNSDTLYEQDDTQGVCTVPKPAGARCAAGTDLCRGSGSFPSLCTGTLCPFIRPGQTCNQGADAATADKCYTGSPAGLACTGTCPALPTPTAPGKGPACVAGDVCLDATAKCNAVGTGQGECVTTVDTGAGVVCETGDYCAVRNVTNPAQAGNLFAQICPTTATATNLKCPLVPAGQVCQTPDADLCSDGGTGLACNDAANADTVGSTVTCKAIASGGKCYANDKCGTQGQFCNAKGSASGICVAAKAAGEKCAVNDLCSTGTVAEVGVPTVCPTSLICPVVPAGAGCQVAIAAGGAGDPAARVADKCNNGNANATIATTDCPSASDGCPVLATGLKCAELSDVCVKGAKCQKGTCQPNGKVFAVTVTSTPAATSAASTSSTGLSSAATVPSVSATATISNYVVTNFSSTVKAQYCNTIQEGILAAYSVVSNCSVGAAASGSVVVPTTVAFSGANEDAATNARDAFAADLKSGTVADVFGSDFGTITVDPDSVVAGTIANPSFTPNGAAAVGMAWTVGVGIIAATLALTV